MSTLADHELPRETSDSWGYGAARLLELFDGGRTELTLEQARVRGVDMPAQAIYALQLAGYVIDRVPIQGSADGQVTAYRLHGTDQHLGGLRRDALGDLGPNGELISDPTNDG